MLAKEVRDLIRKYVLTERGRIGIFKTSGSPG